MSPSLSNHTALSGSEKTKSVLRPQSSSLRMLLVEFQNDVKVDDSFRRCRHLSDPVNFSPLFYEPPLSSNKSDGHLSSQYSRLLRFPCQNCGFTFTTQVSDSRFCSQDCSTSFFMSQGKFLGGIPLRNTNEEEMNKNTIEIIQVEIDGAEEVDLELIQEV